MLPSFKSLCRSVEHGSSKHFMVNMEVYGTIWKYLDMIFGAICRYLELYATIWNYMELDGAIWNYMELPGTIRSYMELYGNIWNYGTIWNYVELTWNFW